MDLTKPFGRWLPVDDRPSGGLCRVFIVRDVDDPTAIAALKVCVDTRDESQKLFLKEIENTERPLLPGKMTRVIGKGERDGMPYFVMPFSRDLDLRRKSTKLALRVTKFLIDCAIDLREQGWIHGDFKPENVGVEVGPDGKGHFVLRDWATLRRMADANVVTAVMGTRYYRSQKVDYSGQCGEDTEIHAIGMSFHAMLPKSKREVYGRPILDAISPSEPPFGQVRTYEELWKLIDGAVGSFHRRVWLLAAVWKTWIVANRVAVATGAVVLVLTVLFFGARYVDSVRRENQYRERHAPKQSVDELVDKGYVAYRSGDMVKAREFLGMAIHTSGFMAGRYPYFDVMGFYEDACEKIGK